MTNDAQTALRRTMEAYSRTTRFCLICNYISRYSFSPSPLLPTPSLPLPPSPTALHLSPPLPSLFPFINLFSRIIEPLASRCAKFRFKSLAAETMKERIQYICKEEKVLYSDELLETLAQVSNGGILSFPLPPFVPPFLSSHVCFIFSILL